ncbi:MAG: hypothetical protein RO469_10670 [Thermincola sp.]|nr:hypothetical protein [Thermincola sp.]MDT3704876.1 hypothetical protein [Thermincola sp.]
MMLGVNRIPEVRHRRWRRRAFRKLIGGGFVREHFPTPGPEVGPMMIRVNKVLLRFWRRCLAAT